MAILVECRNFLAVGNTKQDHGQGHRHPDAQIAGENRNKNPIAKIREKAALLPPGTPLVAGRPARQDGKNQAHTRQPWQHMPQGQQNLLEDLVGDRHYMLTRTLVIFLVMSAKAAAMSAELVRS